MLVWLWQNHQFTNNGTFEELYAQIDKVINKESL
jgi:hypothetical protein